MSIDTFVTLEDKCRETRQGGQTSGDLKGPETPVPCIPIIKKKGLKVAHVKNLQMTSKELRQG